VQFNSKLSWEFLSPDEIASKTLRALRNHVKHVKEVSPYYKEAFWDVNPDDIKHIEDFGRLPLPAGPRSANTVEIRRGRARRRSSKPWQRRNDRPADLLSLTANDIDRLAFSEALSFHSMGITSEDRAMLFTGFDHLSLSGEGCFRGLTLLGATPPVQGP